MATAEMAMGGGFRRNTVFKLKLKNNLIRITPRPNCLHFDAVFGKFWPNNRLASPLWLVPPVGNPGSAQCRPDIWSLAPICGNYCNGVQRRVLVKTEESKSFQSDKKMSQFSNHFHFARLSLFGYLSHIP